MKKASTIREGRSRVKLQICLNPSIREVGESVFRSNKTPSQKLKKFLRKKGI